MAKKKIVGEVPAEEQEVMEVMEGEYEAVDTEAGDDSEPKGKGAPRARRWNYGITMEATVALTEAAKGSKGALNMFEYLQENANALVGDIAANVEDWRHELRVLMRNGSAILTAPDGQTYPQGYDHEAAAEARVARAAAKAAKAEEEVVEE